MDPWFKAKQVESLEKVYPLKNMDGEEAFTCFSKAEELGYF
jgi:hypothetical protein